MKIIDQLWGRIDAEKDDSDSSYFLCLMYLGELLTKLTTVGLLAAVGDDRNNSRYEQLHRLVRTTGVGDWARSIDTTLTGPTAQFLDSAVYVEQRELTQYVTDDSWQYQAIEQMNQALVVIGHTQEPMPQKVQGKNWFHSFATLRNKTRGHGAIPHSVMGMTCPQV